MIRARLVSLLLVLLCSVELNAAGPCQPMPVDKNTSGGAYALSGINNPASFSIRERGAATFDTSGAGSVITVGYTRVQANAGSTTPAGYLIFSFRQNGVLVSEATVSASRAISSGRIYASLDGPVNTGLAIVNPNAGVATIAFYFTDASGNNFGNGTLTLPPNSQIARFVSESPFSAGGPINGTMTFTSNFPVGVIALRGFTNERGEFLITTLPVADLGKAATSDVVYFPHSAVGGGWTTQTILVNPTDGPISGKVQPFLGGTASSYTIAPRSMERIVAEDASASITTQALRVTPNPGSASPSGLSIFSFKNAGVMVSEASVPALRAAQAFRMFEIECGSYPGQLNTGIAVANPSQTETATVTLELTDLSGTATGMSSTLTIPPLGQTAAFIKQLPGFGSIPFPFHGNLRISTTSPGGIAVIGLRGEYNERKDFLITTSMPTNEAEPISSAEALFPHLADGGGYTTEFVLFSGSSGQASTGMLRFFTQAGAPLN